MITLDEIFNRAVDVLERNSIGYMVFGGLALPAWGPVVTTGDVDLLINIEEHKAAGVVAAFRAAGFSLPDNSEITFPIDTWFCASTGGRDVDIALGITDFDRSAFSRAVRVRIFGREVPIASAEDLILYKLTAQRRKDLAHVEAIMARQKGNLDLAYLREWAGKIAEATRKFKVPAILESMIFETVD